MLSLLGYEDIVFDMTVAIGPEIGRFHTANRMSSA